MPSDAPPTRIAFCITDLDDGGAERALVQIVTRLDRRRWEPTVFCLSDEGELADVLRASGTTVVCLRVRSGYDLTAVWRLSRQLAKLRPAILQTFLYHANMVGRLAGKAAGVPIIVSGIRVAEKRSRLRLWIDRSTDWMVAGHICVSQGVAAFSIERGRLPAKKVHVIHNGVDAAMLATAAPADLTQFGIPLNSRMLLYVGRLDPQKNPFVLLNAVKELFDIHRELHVLMVGDGPLRDELHAWVRRENCETRIHFAGRRDDVPSLFRSADLFVLPSSWEGLPNVVLEAMAAGTPIIATNVEGISDLLIDHQTGLVVPPNSVRELSHAIRHVLDHADEARSFAQSAQDYVSERFTWQAVVASYERCYAKLIDVTA